MLALFLAVLVSSASAWHCLVSLMRSVCWCVVVHKGRSCAAATVPAHQSIVDEVVLQHASMQHTACGTAAHDIAACGTLQMAMLCPSWCNTSPMLNCLYGQQNLVSTSKPDNQSADWCVSSMACLNEGQKCMSGCMNSTNAEGLATLH